MSRCRACVHRIDVVDEPRVEGLGDQAGHRRPATPGPPRPSACPITLPLRHIPNIQAALAARIRAQLDPGPLRSAPLSSRRSRPSPATCAGQLLVPVADVERCRAGSTISTDAPPGRDRTVPDPARHHEGVVRTERPTARSTSPPPSAGSRTRIVTSPSRTEEELVHLLVHVPGELALEPRHLRARIRWNRTAIRGCQARPSRPPLRRGSPVRSSSCPLPFEFRLIFTDLLPSLIRAHRDASTAPFITLSTALRFPSARDAPTRFRLSRGTARTAARLSRSFPVRKRSSV